MNIESSRLPRGSFFAIQPPPFASPSFFLFAIAALGAVVGSFLNVVIYRLPLGLSILSPKWSFCPYCRARIRPTDNIPILGWLMLKGRCRSCAAPIGIIYPVIECLTTLVFIAVWDALYTAKLIPTVTGSSTDWPLAIAYLALFAGLVASAAMDVESYTIDIRISVVVMVIAVLAHALRGIPDVALTLPAERPLGLLPPGLCVVAAAMGVTWLGGWAIAAALRRAKPHTALPTQFRCETPPPPSPPSSSQEGRSVGPTSEHGHNTSSITPPVHSQPLPIVIFSVFVVVLLAWQRFAPAMPANLPISPGVIRCLIASSVCMFILILASWVHRPADAEIIDEIEQSRHMARAVAIREFAVFAPALLVGFGVFLWLRVGGGSTQLAEVRLSLRSEWSDVRQMYSNAWPCATFVAGALQAIGGMVIGSALGWTVRILGTLTFGKEAFGTGDIYLMGAIGAAAGVPNLVFGFFLAALLALVGVSATLFRKSSRAIPFGPWLALGSFVALPLEGSLLDFFRHAMAMLWNLISGVPSWQFGG